MDLRFTAAELTDYVGGIFPELAPRLEVTALAPFRLSVRMATTAADLRPGGTVSGPTIFACADCAFYMATLAMIGPVPLAVTTNCAIDFMRKPAPGALVAEARILKLGRTLAVGDVLVFSEGVDGAVARAGLTYAIPPGGASTSAGGASATQKRTSS